MSSLRFNVMAALYCLVLVFMIGVNSQLSPAYYIKTCPNLHKIVHQVLVNASKSDPRIFASLVRLHFHDCFVMGCDASVLLNATASMASEQDAIPNKNSIRGLDVINHIKTAVEKACPKTVSCADILALSAQISTTQSGGPFWNVPLGRLDGLVANQTLANSNLPGPFFTLPLLKAAFSRQGLNTTDLVALSGAHTFGRGQCAAFRGRLYNFSGTGQPDPTLNTTYLTTLRKICPNDNTFNITNLDPTTPNRFDNKYYSNLQIHKGLFQSDQELYSTPGADTISTVNHYINNQPAFFNAFKASMLKMGNIDVITKTSKRKGEIRQQCNVVNKKSVDQDDKINVAFKEFVEVYGHMVGSI